MTHQYTKLADELDATAGNNSDMYEHERDSCREAARILRAAAAVDVQGLMALARKFSIAEAQCTVLCTSKTGKQSPEYERADKEYEVVQDALESALRLALAERDEPQPMHTAPKDGTEILAWREDCGWFIAKWTCVNDLRTTSDQDRDELDEETLFAFDWFGGDSEGNFRCDGSEVPTRWTHLPAAAPKGTP